MIIGFCQAKETPPTWDGGGGVCFALFGMNGNI